MLRIPLLTALGFALSALFGGCSPDSYQATLQIKNLPENAGCRLTQLPNDSQEFVVERTDGSVWRYRAAVAIIAASGIRSGKVQNQAPNLQNEDQILGPTVGR